MEKHLSGHAAAAAALGAEHGSRHALHIAALGEADEHRLVLDQVGLTEGLRRFGGNAGTAIVAVFLGEVMHIVLDQAQDFLWIGEQVLQACDLLRNLFVFFLDLPALESRQTTQLHIQNGLCLKLTQFEALD
jgi:hypothetical protein